MLWASCPDTDIHSFESLKTHIHLDLYGNSFLSSVLCYLFFLSSVLPLAGYFLWRGLLKKRLELYVQLLHRVLNACFRRKQTSQQFLVGIRLVICWSTLACWEMWFVLLLQWNVKCGRKVVIFAVFILSPCQMHVEVWAALASKTFIQIVNSYFFTPFSFWKIYWSS